MQKPHENTSTNLPTQFQRIKFKMDGKQGEFLKGKDVRKHKKNSINRNIIGIQFDEGS